MQQETDLDRLWQLQQIDAERRRLERSLAEHPERGNVEGLQSQLAAARERLAEAEGRARALRAQVRREELEVRSAEGEVERLQERLFGGSVSNPKELASLQARLETARQHLQKRSDATLETMLALEAAEQAIQEATGETQRLAQQLESAQAVWSRTRALLEGSLETAMAQREDVVSRVAHADWLGRYEKLLAAKDGRAMARIEAGEACGGCGVPLAFAVINQARKKERLVYCEMCGRILYWPVDAAGMASAGDAGPMAGS